jgi:hypothetical protein
MPRLVLAIVIGVAVALGGAYATNSLVNSKPDNATVYSYSGA